jgi:hypothetical protein
METNIAGSNSCTVVLELDGLQWASEKSAAEAALGRRLGVVAVQVNPDSNDQADPVIPSGGTE